MDYDVAIKIGLLCVGIVGAAKGLFDLSIGRKSKLREEYNFAKKFLDDIDDNVEIHPYLREKGYQAIAGDTKISAKEMEYLLSLTSPNEAVKDYVAGRNYLEHLSVSKEYQIRFKKKYEARWSRKWRMYGYLVAYILCVFFGTAPLIFASLLHLQLNDSILLFSVSAVVFGPYAWSFLSSGQQIGKASRLVSRQYKRS